MAYSVRNLVPSTRLVVSFLLFYIWNKVVTKVVWFLDGTAQKRKLIESKQETDKIAQVDRIIARPFSEAYYCPSYDRFMCWTEGFITLDSLLGRNITLYNVSIKYQTVSFAEFDQEYDPYEVGKNPFLWYSQLHMAKRIIRIPLHVFYEMTSSVDPSSMRVVFFHQTARCGSTVWSQIFNKIPDCVVISECMSLARMFFEEVDNAGEFIESKECEKIVGAVIKFHMSRFQDKKMLFIKATYGDHLICKVIGKIFPDHRILFGYRDPLPSAKSWYEIIDIHYDMRFIHTVLKYWTNCTSPFLDSYRMYYTHNYKPCDKIMRRVRPQDPFEWYMAMWCLRITIANQALNENIDIRGVKYDYLVKNPEKTVTKVFEFVGVDVECVKDVLKAMRKDSQENTPTSHRLRKDVLPWKSTTDGIRRCNEVLNYFGFGDLHTVYRFPNDLY